MTTAIKFEHVKKYFASKLVVNDLNLDIHQGELFVLVGNSGSGKTTSIKMINRLKEPSEGNILVNNRKVTDYNLRSLRWNIGYVFQQNALFPNMTVAENIALVPMLKGEQINQQQMVERLLHDVGLDAERFYNRYPKDLSGGEQQKIGILRAIAANPQIILMDEPFSALDPLARNNLQNLVLDLHRKMNNTIVFVTHDMNEAFKLADRIGIMKNGKLVQVDQPQTILSHPANSFVEDFFHGSMVNGFYETPVSQACLLLKLNPKPHNLFDNLITIDERISLAQVLQFLSKAKEIRIQDQNNKCQGYIDHQWLIEYLNIIRINK